MRSPTRSDADNRPIAHTEAGAVEGIVDGAVAAWLGIPYAESPVGEFRFRPPQPTRPWSGVRSANEFGPVPWQVRSTPNLTIPNMIREGAVESEDCLTLNVWSLAADDQRRPVLVWFHPGANMYGAGSSPRVHPSVYARKYGLVIVTVNHRLGPWGFLHLGSIDSAFPDTRNLAVLDQIAALRWVGHNIADFGGDPDNVTLFGLSSGASNISTLLTVPRARGLFHKAAIYSGRPDLARDREFVTANTRQFVEVLADSIKGLENLRAAPNVALRFAHNALTRRLGRNPYYDYVDGDIIPRPWEEAFATGAIRDVPLLVSVTAEEGLLFPAVTGERELSVLDQLGEGHPEVQELRERYRRTDPDITHADATLAGDLAFYGPALRLITAHSRAGGRAWLQIYNYVPTSSADDLSLGAIHGRDAESLFLSEATSDSAADIASAEAHQEPLVALARSGTPHSSHVHSWEPYTFGNNPALVIDRSPHLAELPPRPGALLDLNEQLSPRTA